MSFPTTVFTNATDAYSAFMTKAGENGLAQTVLCGVEPTMAGVLANLFDGLPAGTNAGQALPTPAGTGITAGVGTIYQSGVIRAGGVITTRIVMDLTGLNSGGTAGDIIGVNGTANPCHIGRITPAVNGTIIGARMTWLEAPVTGDTDIDLYAATEGTGVEDQAIADLTETQIINTGTISLGTVGTGSADIPANSYLYLVGQGTSNATYTAGRFLLELIGV